MRSYAIGDIHGHRDLLIGAHERIARDRRAVGDDAAPIIHIGDLVDRGPDSAGVMEHLAAGLERGENWIVLKGNHDRMLALFLDDPAATDPRLRIDFSYLHPNIGGASTLASYGVDVSAGRAPMDIHAEAEALIPDSHRRFLRGLRPFHRRDEALFVHAGIRPGVPLEDQSEDDLLWIREPFLDSTADHGPLVIHGHTPAEAATNYGNRVNIDSGAAFGGPLSAVVIEGRDVWLLTESGRVPLPPVG